jgi:CBS domain containing-hemolysin-like protein
VASIRAIVEIDQAQCDRTWQRWEKKRDKRQQELLKQAEEKAKAAQEGQKKLNEDLQDQIQAVGVGIAAGAIMASSSGLITHPWGFPSRDRLLLPPHPFIIALAISSLFSVGAWWLTKKKIERKRNRVS